jgi:hypothetical protein
MLLAIAGSVQYYWFLGIFTKNINDFKFNKIADVDYNGYSKWAQWES